MYLFSNSMVPEWTSYSKGFLFKQTAQSVDLIF